MGRGLRDRWRQDRQLTMSESNRKTYLAGVRTVVVKLGTQLLSGGQGRLDAAFIATIAAQIADLRRRGLRVALVSSGAIGCGLRELKLDKRPTDLGRLQAVAAVGQRRLMDVWAAAFEPLGLPVAQLLLTRDDIDDRTRFLNVRNTIVAADELGAVPIINENDTVSTDELVKITFGDNDILAALVAQALRAELLILLSVVDGLLDESGQSVRLVRDIDEARRIIRAEKSPEGKGGMDSKVNAARMMTDAGEALVVADGRQVNVLSRILDGDDVGTLFAPASKKRSSRMRWIGSARPAGTIIIDAGASRALLEQGRSLLPAGIVSVEGHFSRGDIVAITTGDARIIARGLTNYSADDIAKIRGKKTQDVRLLLAEAAYDEVIHRDNLFVDEAGSA